MNTEEITYYPQSGNTVGLAVTTTSGIVIKSAKAGSFNLPRTATSHEVVSVFPEGEKQAVEAIFGTSSPMVGIAGCESSWRQFRADGSPLLGGMNNHFVGIFQLHQSWQKKAQTMGLDIYTVQGNILFAKYLMETEGLSQWECSGV